MSRPPLPREHGTMRGVNQHRYNGEPLCPACTAARRPVHQREQYEQRNAGRCAPGLGWPLVARRG